MPRFRLSSFRTLCFWFGFFCALISSILFSVSNVGMFLDEYRYIRNVSGAKRKNVHLIPSRINRTRKEIAEAKKRKQSKTTTTTPEGETTAIDAQQTQTMTCRPVYFWGGGKAGSTTLAELLNNAGLGLHNSTNRHRSPFTDIVKEICWVLKPRNRPKWETAVRNGCRDNHHEFVLDACPRYTSTSHAISLLRKDPDAKFLMLVRDPIDRIVSHFNDQRRRGGKQRLSVESMAKKLIPLTGSRKLVFASEVLRLSRYGENLWSLLSVLPDREQVLVVPTEALRDDLQQRTFDAISDHVGIKRRRVERYSHSNRGSNPAVKHVKYQTIQNDTRRALQDLFTSDVELLETLVGRTFPWSWTERAVLERNNSNSSNSSLLFATVPLGETLQKI